MPDGTKGGYPADWEGKSLRELANEDGTYGKNHSTEEEVEVFTYAMAEARTFVLNEMIKQVAKWGVQDHPMFRINKDPDGVTIDTDDNYLMAESEAKFQCENNHKLGVGTWCDILLEELAEAAEAARRTNDPTGYSIPYPEGVGVYAETPEQAKEWVAKIEGTGADDVFLELVQVAAVASAMVTAVLAGRNRDFYVEQVAKLKLERQQMRRLKEALFDAVNEEYTPGGYI